MTVQEVARRVMKITGVTQREIAAKAGLPGQGSVGMYLQSKSMRVDNLVKILSICGYELVARSVDGKFQEFVIGNELSDELKAEKAEQTDEEKMREMIRKIVAEELGKK